MKVKSLPNQNITLTTVTEKHFSQQTLDVKYSLNMFEHLLLFSIVLSK